MRPIRAIRAIGRTIPPIPPILAILAIPALTAALAALAVLVLPAPPATASIFIPSIGFEDDVDVVVAPNGSSSSSPRKTRMDRTLSFASSS